MRSYPPPGSIKHDIPERVDFPTPPFADDTAITCPTSFILRRWGKPRCIRANCGGEPERGKPLAQVSKQGPRRTQFMLTSGFSCCRCLNIENRRVDMMRRQMLTRQRWILNARDRTLATTDKPPMGKKQAYEQCRPKQSLGPGPSNLLTSMTLPREVCQQKWTRVSRKC